jgi:hypothetical protein
MVRFLSACALVCVFVLSSAVTQGAPLNVTIEDHDFTFDVANAPDWQVFASYNYEVPLAQDPARDLLTVNLPCGHYVHGYTYTGKIPTASPVAPSPHAYPVYAGTQPAMFGGNLDLAMLFDMNDGPYTNGADTYDISLYNDPNKDAGHVTITGWLATQSWPPSALHPNPPADVTLLDIDLESVSLLAKAGSDRIFKVEGIGTVTTLLGEDVQEELTGTIYYEFMADPGTVIFPAGYDPLAATDQSPVQGRISGEAGIIPEPATFSLLALGGLLALHRRRG